MCNTWSDSLRSAISRWRLRRPSTASMSARFFPYTFSTMRRSRYTVNPSLSQKSLHVALSVDPGPLADGLELQVADRQGDEVRRHRLFHQEAVLPGARVLRIVGRAHDGEDTFGRSYPGAVGDAYAGRVLQRDPAPRV